MQKQVTNKTADKIYKYACGKLTIYNSIALDSNATITIGKIMEGSYTRSGMQCSLYVKCAYNIHHSSCVVLCVACLPSLQEIYNLNGPNPSLHTHCMLAQYLLHLLHSSRAGE